MSAMSRLQRKRYRPVGDGKIFLPQKVIGENKNPCKTGVSAVKKLSRRFPQFAYWTIKRRLLCGVFVGIVVLATILIAADL